MKHICLTFAVVASLAVVAGAHAQQQQFGRDSVYAVPGKSNKASAPVSGAPVNRFGRDSVYAKQTPNVHSTPVPADAKSPQQYGRDSVFAYGAPNPPSAGTNEAKADSTGQRHGG